MIGAYLPSVEDGREHVANVVAALGLAVADRISEAVTGASDMPLSDATALSALHHVLRDPSIEQLRRVLGLTHSGAVRLVDRLVAAGLVRRESGPDGRTSAISLTAAGETSAIGIGRARLDVLDGALAALDDHDCAELDRIAGRLLVAMMRGPDATRWVCRLCDTDACGRYRGQCPIGREVARRARQEGEEGMDIAEINRSVIAQFRAGQPIEGMDRDRLLLLTTTGRHSGVLRTTPVMFHRDGDRLMVVASNMGAPAHPGWYLNLLADSHVTVEIGDESYPAIAQPAKGDDRDHLWEGLVASNPFFADHQDGLDRIIPIVVLERIST